MQNLRYFLLKLNCDMEKSIVSSQENADSDVITPSTSSSKTEMLAFLYLSKMRHFTNKNEKSCQSITTYTFEMYFTANFVEVQQQDVHCFLTLMH